MQSISFDEAKRLINANEAGFFCIDGRQIRPHDVQIAVYSEDAWWLCTSDELTLDDQGLIDTGNAWAREILVYADNDCPIAAMLQRDAARVIERNRLRDEGQAQSKGN